MNNKERRKQYQEKYQREFPRNWFKYCKDPLENIEGWAEMLNDTYGQRWQLHHRDEISEDGVVVTREVLKSRGQYTNLPASKLVFMTEFEHHSLHKPSEETKKKISENNWMRDRTGDKNPMYGRTGEKHPASKPIEIEGVKYCSRKAAAEALEKKERTIYNWVKQGKARYI